MRREEKRRMAESGVPHVLLFPYPAHGHVLPMLKLAAMVSNAGFYVTFVNTEDINCRFLRTSSAFKRLSKRPLFRFRTIPDGLPEDDPRPFLQFLEMEESLRTRSREPYRELLVPTSGRDPGGWPLVSCVITDGILRLALEVAEEMEIPAMILRTSSACSVWAYYSIPELIKTGELPFHEDASMDELMQGVKGMESFLRRRDLPGLMRNRKSVNDSCLQFLIAIGNNLPRAKAFILNSVEQLEASTLPYIRSICPITYTIGPLQLLQKTFKPIGDTDSSAQSSSTVGLWQQDRSCMTWLDCQPRNSVVYISFGSITIVSQETILEFWHGLVSSGRQFLWAIRPDMIEGGVGAEEIIQGTSEKGCLVKWAPQEEVLAHPAVGCFLTHSGWNSTIESIVAGVPMICWPFTADQQINSRFVSEVWKIGIDMKDMCGRSTVEEMVRKAMDGEEAETLRTRASEMAEMVKTSAGVGGSSYMNFHKLIQHIRSLSSKPTNKSMNGSRN